MPVTATFTGRPARCGAVVTLIGAALTFGVGPAHAAGEGHAWVGQHAFHFRAASGQENQVYMWRDVARFYVQDNGAPVTQGSGCFRQTSRRVACPASGVTRVFARTRDRNDVIDVGALTVRATLYDGDGNDVAYGGGGHDNIGGGAGNDTLAGRGGNDILHGWSPEGADRLIGGGGVDTAMYRPYPVPVSLDSDGLTGDDGANGEGDTIQADVENLEGGKAADHVFGSGVSNYLKGNAGDDQVFGLGGNDVLHGDAGYDVLSGGTGYDFCLVGANGGSTTGCEAFARTVRRPARR